MTYNFVAHDFGDWANAFDVTKDTWLCPTGEIMTWRDYQSNVSYWQNRYKFKDVISAQKAIDDYNAKMRSTKVDEKVDSKICKCSWDTVWSIGCQCGGS